MPFQTIITDEGHRLGNPRTKMYKALSKLKANSRYVLTATPLMNKIDELWGLLNFISPGKYSSYWNFLNRYCIKNQWGAVIAYQNVEELKNSMKSLVIRKRLDEVEIELPSKTFIDLTFKLSTEELKLQKQMKMELLFEIDKPNIAKIENPANLQITLVKLGKLSELADSLELLGYNKKSSKLEVLKEHLKDTITNGTKALIFSRFERMVTILNRELFEYKPLIITGATKNRQEIIDKFNNESENKLLIMTEAGGVGINLGSANIVYHYDLPYSIGKYEQRIGRVHGIGRSKKPVFIYNLIAQKSFDEFVKKKLWNKQGLNSDLLGDPMPSLAEIREMLLS